MNKFVKIIEVNAFTGNFVHFYTVHIEGRDNDEFTDFIARHIGNRDIVKQINYLNEILENFSKNGAKAYYFRDERSFHALPPPAKFLEVDFRKRQLRLYCLRISDRIVFLFNGGIKTTQKAQDCQNVSKYFNEAEKLTLIIDNALKDKELIKDPHDSYLENFNNAELWLI